MPGAHSGSPQRLLRSASLLLTGAALAALLRGHRPESGAAFVPNAAAAHPEVSAGRLVRAPEPHGARAAHRSGTARNGDAAGTPLVSAVAALTLLGVGSLLRGAVTRYSGGKPVAAPGIRILRPKTNARRNMSVPTYEEITEKRVYKPLAKHYQQAYARNKNGKRLLQCRGAVKTHTKLYRTIDFSRRKRNMFGTVMSIEYDPFRNARICRVKYEDGENRYVLWCMGMFVGQTIISAEDAPPFVGNAMPMKNVPNGTQICNFEEKPGLHTSAYARAAGTFGTVLSKDRGFVCVKMPSTEIKLFYDKCWCTVGRIGRIEHFLIKLGKADVTRHMGFRPRVRGKAKNACDHPHGGGEGRSSIGHRFRCTPKGKNRFARTRPRSLYSNRFILQRALTRRRKNMQK